MERFREGARASAAVLDRIATDWTKRSDPGCVVQGAIPTRCGWWTRGAAAGGRAIRRRRECVACGNRFTTYEHVDVRRQQVLKRDGSAEDFQRDKLRDSIAVACAKRPVSAGEIEALAQRVADAIVDSARVEISSREIGEAVMKELKPVDRVAYIRFASVYRNFQGIGEFREAVDELIVRERDEVRDRIQGRLPLPQVDQSGPGD